MSKGNKTLISKRQQFSCSQRHVIHGNQGMTPASVSVVTVEYYSALKKEILSFVTTWMKPEGIVPSKIKQRERGRYDMVALTCGI